MPLQVYLDSSDFSTLSRPSSRSPAHDVAERRLIELQDSGAIELRFSYAHVIEAAPIRPDDVDLAREVLRYIKRLCGNLCLIDPVSLMEREALRSSRLLSATTEGPFRNDGIWVPPLAPDAIPKISPLARQLREELESGNLPRKEKRAEMRRHFTSSGKLKLASANALKTSKLQGIEDAFPLSSDAVDTLWRYTLGDCSSVEVHRSLIASISDLDTFADWYAKHWDRVAPISSWLRAGGSAFTGICEAVVKTLEGFTVDSKIAVDEQLHAAFRREVDLMPSRLASRFLGAGSIEPPGPVCATWDTAPGLVVISGVMAQIHHMFALVPPQQRRKPRVSDYGDILHALYLPYVDFFRADGTTARAIRAAKLQASTIVVPKFLELPAAIELELARRSRAPALGNS